MSLQVDEEQHPEQLNLKQHQATGRGNSKRNSKQVDEEQHPEQLNPKQHQATGRGNSKHNSIKTAVNTVLASNELIYIQLDEHVSLLNHILTLLFHAMG